MIEYRADSKDHPECRYSTATSKNCGSYNGKYSCETIRRVFKRCPNVPPEKIYEKTTTDTGSYDPSGGNGGVLGGGDDPKFPGIDPVRPLLSFRLIRLSSVKRGLRCACNSYSVSGACKKKRAP